MTGFFFLPVAHVAQLVEHILGKDEVTSSILVVGSREIKKSTKKQEGGFELCLSRGLRGRSRM